MALLVLSACAPAPAASPSLTASQMPTVAVTPTPTLSEQQQAAGGLIGKFYEVQNQIANNYEVPLESLYQVAGGELAQERLPELQRMRAAEASDGSGCTRGAPSEGRDAAVRGRGLC